MEITIASKRRKQEALAVQFPEAKIIDVTSKGILPWVKFSPFYPHGNIPVPFSPGVLAAPVEGIWQGLKVFEQADIDIAKFSNLTMKGIKRSTRTNGRILGHRAGIAGQKLLAYREACYTIYLPAYKWVLDNYLLPETAELREYAASQPVILLDYETNADVENLTSPLSHAALIVRYIEGYWHDLPSKF